MKVTISYLLFTLHYSVRVVEYTHTESDRRSALLSPRGLKNDEC